MACAIEKSSWLPNGPSHTQPYNQFSNEVSWVFIVWFFFHFYCDPNLMCSGARPTTPLDISSCPWRGCLSFSSFQHRLCFRNSPGNKFAANWHFSSSRTTFHLISLVPVIWGCACSGKLLCFTLYWRPWVYHRSFISSHWTDLCLVTGGRGCRWCLFAAKDVRHGNGSWRDVPSDDELQLLRKVGVGSGLKDKMRMLGHVGTKKRSQRRFDNIWSITRRKESHLLCSGWFSSRYWRRLAV